ncbi:MAG: hypothetical protein QOE94_2324 [Mycobacterium sp.]|nr:hypothetical protein [Mycobacterium sp.]
MHVAILVAAVRVSAATGTGTNGRSSLGRTPAVDATLPAHCRSPDLLTKRTDRPPPARGLSVVYRRTGQSAHRISQTRVGCPSADATLVRGTIGVDHVDWDPAAGSDLITASARPVPDGRLGCRVGRDLLRRCFLGRRLLGSRLLGRLLDRSLRGRLPARDLPSRRDDSLYDISAYLSQDGPRMQTSAKLQVRGFVSGQYSVSCGNAACDQLQTFAAVARHHAPLRRDKPTAGWPRFVDANDLPARAFRPTVTSICNLTTKYIALQTIL